MLNLKSLSCYEFAVLYFLVIAAHLILDPDPMIRSIDIVILTYDALEMYVLSLYTVLVREKPL